MTAAKTQDAARRAPPLSATRTESLSVTLPPEVHVADDVSPEEDGVIGPIAWIELPRRLVTAP